MELPLTMGGQRFGTKLTKIIRLELDVDRTRTKLKLSILLNELILSLTKLDSKFVKSSV